MHRIQGVRLTLLVLLLLTAGCHMRRPGEVQPTPIAACEPQRVAILEARYEQITAAERELLSYCRTAQAAQALSATQEHVDYIADLQFLGIVLTAVSVVLAVFAEAL